MIEIRFERMISGRCLAVVSCPPPTLEWSLIMIRYIPRELHDQTLAQWRGAFAQVWAFHVSHKRLMIRLSSPPSKDPGCLLIAVATCGHMCGPFSWRDADIAIHTRGGTDETDEGLTTILDVKAGFELRNGGASLLYSTSEGIEYVLDDIYKDLEGADS